LINSSNSWEEEEYSVTCNFILDNLVCLFLDDEVEEERRMIGLEEEVEDG